VNTVEVFGKKLQTVSL